MRRINRVGGGGSAGDSHNPVESEGPAIGACSEHAPPQTALGEWPAVEDPFLPRAPKTFVCDRDVVGLSLDMMIPPE